MQAFSGRPQTGLFRWLIVLAAAFGILSGFGVSATVSVLIKPFEAEFGWLRADIAFSYALFSAGAALGGLFAGWALDRMDARPIVVFGAVVMSAGLYALSFQTSLFAIQAIYLAIGVFGFSCLYTPLLAVTGMWFERGRGLAMGLVTAGGTLGQGFVPFIAQPLIEQLGWRETMTLAGIGCAGTLVLMMMLVSKPRIAEPAAGGAAPARERTWPLPLVISIGWIGAAALFCCAAMAVPLVHLVTLFSDRALPSSTSGALMLTLMLAATLGRVGFGIVSDRLGALRSYGLAVMMQTLTVYGFVVVDDIALLYLLSALFGFGFGGVMVCLILSVREAVPVRHAGLSTAIVGMLAWVGMGAGGWQGGYCYDATGDYALAFANAAFAGILNMAILAGLALHLRWHRRIAVLTARIFASLLRGSRRPRPGLAGSLVPVRG